MNILNIPVGNYSPRSTILGIKLLLACNFFLMISNKKNPYFFSISYAGF
jgi:hypothetical protein